MSTSQRFRVTCPSCKAPFIYTETDVTMDVRKSRGRQGGTTWFVTCPDSKCKQIIKIANPDGEKP